MKRKKRRWARRVARLVILALLGCGAYFIGFPMLQNSVTTTYDTYVATTGSISKDLSFSGSFAVKKSETLTAPSSATVRSVHKAVGDKVTSGDRILRLSDGTMVKASIEGTINTLDVSEGDEVQGGKLLCQIVDFSTLSVSINVDEYDIGEVYVGQSCVVTATAQEQSFEAEITSVNYVSQSTGNVAYYTATADVAVSEDIYPGMRATITIPKESVENAVILRMDALSFDRANRAFVWMKDEKGELRQVDVQVGMDNGSYVEIVSGLSDGDTVYVEAREEESAGGIMSLFSGLQRNRFNETRGNRANWNRNGNNNGFGNGNGMPAGAPGVSGGGMPGRQGGN